MSASNIPIFFFKEDLDRAFRQIGCCPRSAPLLGYKWRELYYFDVVLVMGCRSAPYICQRVTNMIRYLHNQMEYFLLNYVDDFLGAETADWIWDSYNVFIRLLDNIGAVRSAKKSIPPTQIVEWVGTLFNAIDGTIGITPVRKVEILTELNKWRFKTTTSHSELELLVAKLQFVANCVQLGRLFVSRLLQELKAMNRTL